MACVRAYDVTWYDIYDMACGMCARMIWHDMKTSSCCSSRCINIFAFVSLFFWRAVVKSCIVCIILHCQMCRHLLSKDRRSKGRGSASCWTDRFRVHHLECRHIIFIRLSYGFGDSFSLPLSPSECLQTWSYIMRCPSNIKNWCVWILPPSLSAWCTGCVCRFDLLWSDP